MGLSIISFTEKGMRLSKKIAGLWESDSIEVYTKCSAVKARESTGQVRYAEEPVAQWAGRQMAGGHILLFIGACGIAVRAIAPWLKDKLHDSPVLVMDENGMHVIPILSGHVGGANEIALQIAEKTGAAPVITTATDINNRFSVDIFAKKNGFHIVNREGIAKVSSKVLAGAKITMSVEPIRIIQLMGELSSGQESMCSRPPVNDGRQSSRLEGLRMVPYPPEGFVDIVITGEDREFETALLLRPKEYVIGMGCRRGKEAGEIEGLIDRSLKEAGISRWQILALASIDRKEDEEGLLVFSRTERIPFLTYTAEELKEVKGSRHASAFVKEQTGVDNVCERAALRACGPVGKLVYERHAENGMTIAIAKKEWNGKGRK